MSDNDNDLIAWKAMFQKQPLKPLVDALYGLRPDGGKNYAGAIKTWRFPIRADHWIPEEDDPTEDGPTFKRSYESTNHPISNLIVGTLGRIFFFAPGIDLIRESTSKIYIKLEPLYFTSPLKKGTATAAQLSTPDVLERLSQDVSRPVTHILNEYGFWYVVHKEGQGDE